MKESALTSSNRLGGAVISDRIVASLLEELRTGRYARADRLPAEVDLAAELGVSRTVIRDALSEMERAGYIERVRGIGTVVNRSVFHPCQSLILHNPSPSLHDLWFQMDSMVHTSKRFRLPAAKSASRCPLVLSW